MNIWKSLMEQEANEDQHTTMPESTTASIHDLSDEILDYIFSFLNLVQRTRNEVVCKRWRQLGRTPTQLRLDPHFFKYRKLDDGVLCCILSRYGRTLKELVFKPNTNLTCESLTKIGDYCPNLVTLELHLVGSSQVGCLKTIALICCNLKILKLENHVHVPKLDVKTYNTDLQVNYRKTYYKTCNKGLFAVAQNCKALERLYISNLMNVTLHWLGVINPNLHALCLHKCRLTAEGMQCLIRRCVVLQKFTLDRCEPIDHGVLMEFLKNFKRTLTVFRVTLQGFEDDWREGLKILANLEVLQLYLCDRVDDNLMEVISQKCTKLRLLDIGDTAVSDVGLVALQRLPGLKELRIGRMIANSALNISGYGLELLVAKGRLRQVTILPRSPELEAVCRNLSVVYPKVHFIKEPMPCSCGIFSESW